ncbi:MAG: acyltransferase [Candidatus Omnitrophica bacterium]|nr:acyltransferase [Candidatus Omnitrophota bacterium]
MPIKNCKFGKNVVIPHKDLVNLYGCQIGDNSRVGGFVEIQKNAKIGKNVKISSHTFICEGVTIEDEVFIGHNVSFINDKYPRSCVNGRIQTEKDWRVTPLLVKKGASVGSGSVIMCGVTIGRGAMIGAGSLVVKDVPAGQIWIGSPAKFLKKI